MVELNKIYNEDCFKGLLQLVGQKIDLIVTDPPYNVKTSGFEGKLNDAKKIGKCLTELNQTNLDKGYNIIEFANIVDVLQGKNINVYFWCNKKQIPEYFDFYVKENDCKFDILCWHKSNALPTYYNKYLTDTEYLLFFHKNIGVHPETYEDAKTFDISPINYKDKKQYGHPTIKPVNWIEKIIRNSSKEGDTILDPFIGSGTTAIAAINTKRNFIGFEISEEYFNIANNRINETLNKLNDE